jgi:hypothetical protein
MFVKFYRLPGSIFDPEDGGSIFHHNVGKLIPDYTAVIYQKTVLFNFAYTVQGTRLPTCAFLDIKLVIMSFIFHQVPFV